MLKPILKPKLKTNVHNKIYSKKVVKDELYKLNLYKAPLYSLNTDDSFLQNQSDFLVNSLTFNTHRHFVRTARRWIYFNEKTIHPVLYYSVGWDLTYTDSEMILFTSTDLKLELDH